MIRDRAAFTVEAVKEREQVTDHDVAAFVDVVAESVGEAGRWVHHGLTSSDVLDTGLALQLSQAAMVLVGGAHDYRDALIRRAREQVDTLCVGPHPRRPRRADDLRGQARGLRVRGAPQHAPARARGRGRVGGRAVRRGRHLRRQRPRDRGGGAAPARARARGRVDAGRAARPPRRAARGDRARGGGPRALCHRDPPPAADGGPRGRGALPRGRAEGLVRDAAQAQPDRDRAHLGHRPAAARRTP